MPFPMRIQPVNFNTPEPSPCDQSYKPHDLKSRFKRLFERQFSGLLRSSSDVSDEFEPSSVCLAKMVQNFIEEGDDKHKCYRNRCNGTDNSDEEGELNHTCNSDAYEILKGLVPCPSVFERNVLADTTKIIEKNVIGKRKDKVSRKMVVDGLLAVGYDASICESRWERTPSTPAGVYEYVDVVIEGERLLIDIDFRSEFEIARSSKTYKCLLQLLPNIFVGKADRLQKIVYLLSEAAKLSLKKKGMPCPPWRKAEYVKAKWLSPYTRTTPSVSAAPIVSNSAAEAQICPKTYQQKQGNSKDSCGKLELIIEDSKNATTTTIPISDCCGEAEKIVDVHQSKPPEIKRMNSHNGTRKVTGLSSLIED